MNKYLVGFISGFIATIVISLLLRLKTEYGIMPEFDLIQDYNQFLGLAADSPFSWILHFILGALVWGGIFALISGVLMGPYWIRGISFGVIAWLLMMVAYMPVMEHGFFGGELGIHITIVTLVLHIIYGLVLGLVYGWLPKESAPKKSGQ